MLHTTCLLIDHIYIIHAVLTIVLLLYTTIYMLLWLIVLHKHNSRVFYSCLWRMWIFSMFSNSVRLMQYWRLFLLDLCNNSNTLTCSLPFTNLSAIKLDNFDNFDAFELPPSAFNKLDGWFVNAGLMSCQPTFAGVQSHSGFAFTSIKLSWTQFLLTSF